MDAYQQLNNSVYFHTIKSFRVLQFRLWRSRETLAQQRFSTRAEVYFQTPSECTCWFLEVVWVVPDVLQQLPVHLGVHVLGSFHQLVANKAAQASEQDLPVNACSRRREECPQHVPSMSPAPRGVRQGPAFPRHSLGLSHSPAPLSSLGPCQGPLPSGLLPLLGAPHIP